MPFTAQMRRVVITSFVLAACAFATGCNLLKGQKDTEEESEAPTLETAAEEPAAEPAAETGAAESEPTPEAADVQPAPNPASPGVKPKPTVTPKPSASAKASAAPTASSSPSKMVQCTAGCQSALQGCLTPKPGQLPDATKCQAGFEACRKACQ